MGLHCTKPTSSKYGSSADRGGGADTTYAKESHATESSRRDLASPKLCKQDLQSPSPKLYKRESAIRESSNKLVYLRDEDGQEMSSSQMRGLAPTRPEISLETIEVLESSWLTIKKDIEHVGVVMFIGLFEDSIGVKSTFERFHELTEAELLASTQLRSHALQVMGSVEKVVARLREPEKLVTILHDLGQRHVQFNARPEYLDLIGPQFSNAIQPAMEDLWTPKVEQAWADLFRYITHIMKETMVM